MTISEVLAWGMSIFGAVAWWLYGNKSRWGAIAGLVHQAIVAVYAISCEHWGLLPGIALYIVVHCRNWRKWVAESAEAVTEIARVSECVLDKEAVANDDKK